MTKKIILILIIIIIIFLIIFFSWKNFINKKNINLEKQNQQNQENILINKKQNSVNNKEEIKENLIKKEEVLIQLTNSSDINTYWFYQNNIFYLNQKNEVFKIDENKNIKQITRLYEEFSLIKTYSSPDEKKVLMAFNNPYKPQWLMFDNLDIIWRPLPENIIEANWLNNNEILAILKENNNYKLVKINKEFNIQVVLNNFNFFDFYILPINEEKIILQEKPDSQRAIDTKIFVFNLKNQQLISLKKDNLKDLLIKPLNENLFLRYNDYDYLIINHKDSIEKISIKTLINKCAREIKENTIILYCFIPEQDFNLNQYLQKEIITNDVSIIKIILTKNEQKSINIKQYKSFLNLNQNQIIDTDKVMILNEELYFINRYDKNLYKLKAEKILNEPIDEYIDVTEN